MINPTSVRRRTLLAVSGAVAAVDLLIKAVAEHGLRSPVDLGLIQLQLVHNPRLTTAANGWASDWQRDSPVSTSFLHGSWTRTLHRGARLEVIRRNWANEGGRSR